MIFAAQQPTPMCVHPQPGIIAGEKDGPECHRRLRVDRESVTVIELWVFSQADARSWSCTP